MLAEALSKFVCPEEIRMLQKNDRFKAYQTAVDAAVYALGEGKSVEKALCLAKEYMGRLYKGDMFSFDWMKDIQINDDLQCLKRALDYLFSDGEKVEGTKIHCSMLTELYDGTVETVVDLILKRKNGVFVAVNLNLGKGSRSPKGKSLKTQAQGNPACVVAKGCLEKTYPGIIVWDVYLSSPSDSPGKIAGEFFMSQTAESQLQVLPYKEFYEDGEWNESEFHAFAQRAFSEVPDPPCIFCTERYLCKNGAVVLEPQYDAVMEEKRKYELPTYTPEQQQVIRQGEGASLVVAGPGSGKTATLVGRLAYLVKECNVPPEFILAITFTTKAAGEIRERCTFLEEGEEINISTLNALGYNILNSHRKEAGIDSYSLLTQSDNLSLIDSLLDVRGNCLQGFSYAMKEGSKGLLNTVASRLARYRSNPEGFREKENVGEDFYQLAEDYFTTLKEGNFIDFSQQISLCVKLLEENTELLESYQQMFWYVCVDEYQDIDETQCALIDLLAAGHGNLMAIGDDDQSIYEFRGGSYKFMMDFKNRYPNGKMFFLSKNFRSTASIVSLAANNISNNISLTRFDKEIVSVKEDGVPPVITEDVTFSTQVRSAFETLLAEGICPEDIAVLSWGNDTLETVARELPDYPLHLEKEYLCRSAFCTFVRTILVLTEDLQDDTARREYFSLFGLSCPGSHAFEKGFLSADATYPYVEIGNAECAYSCLKSLAGYLGETGNVKDYLKKAAEVAGYKAQPVFQQMLDLVENKRIKNLKALKEELMRMVRVGDDTRLVALHPGKTVLTTVHESKGREWKAVIVLDDFGKKPSPAVSRLIYVALTRAEERLFICKQPGPSLLVS